MDSSLTTFSRRTSRDPLKSLSFKWWKAPTSSWRFGCTAHIVARKIFASGINKARILKLADRLSVSGFSVQPVWAGEQFDPTVQGYAITDLSRGLTLPHLALAVSGTTELYSHDGLLCLGPPSRATVIQRNGRIGRTQPGAAINLHPGIERTSHPRFAART